MFKQFRTYLPTIKAQDGNTILFDTIHLKKYLNEELFQNLLALTPEEKEIWFRMNSEYSDLLKKLLGTNVMNYIVQEAFILHEATQGVREDPRSDGVDIQDNLLLNEYREWLKKQE